MNDILRSYEGAMVTHISQALRIQGTPGEYVEDLAQQSFAEIKAEADVRFHILASARNILKQGSSAAEKAKLDV